jgi:glutathione S-transferase
LHISIENRAISNVTFVAARGKTYLVAEQFSLAEVCYMPFLDFLPLMEIGPPPAVASWSQRLLARPSAVATRPEK